MTVKVYSYTYEPGRRLLSLMQNQLLQCYQLCDCSRVHSAELTAACIYNLLYIHSIVTVHICNYTVMTFKNYSHKLTAVSMS